MMEDIDLGGGFTYSRAWCMFDGGWNLFLKHGDISVAAKGSGKEWQVSHRLLPLETYTRSKIDQVCARIDQSEAMLRAQIADEDAELRNALVMRDELTARVIKATELYDKNSALSTVLGWMSVGRIKEMLKLWGG